MLCSLTSNSGKCVKDVDVDNKKAVSLVGGKAASLMKLCRTPGLSAHVPKAFALTTHFFEQWLEAVTSSPGWHNVKERIRSDAGIKEHAAETAMLCNQIKEFSRALPLGSEQAKTLVELKEELSSWGGLAAVRSSAVEEDGSDASFAGIFETKLGITEETLEMAVRDCFASVFDYRVFSYCINGAVQYQQRNINSELHNIHNIAFAVVVMEMVDSHIAGVAFSANPLNSDLDEIVIDSSWGLGASVVDGSVVADYFVWDKVSQSITEKRMGSKTQEKRLAPDGGVLNKSVEKARQELWTLSEEQLQELARFVFLIESAYQTPMDIEWAYAYTDTTNTALQLKLLQARPITTIYRLDEDMITPFGAPRVLYYDFNIASEATTTSPFTAMDLSLYSAMSSIMMGAPHVTLFPEDPRMPFFNASTRQYCNLSLVFKIVSPQYCASKVRVLDPYLANIFNSSDCSREKYRAKSFPKEVSILSAWRFMRQFPLWKLYKKKNKYNSRPKESVKEYLKIKEACMTKLKWLEDRGMDKQKGLMKFASELLDALIPSIFEELGVVAVILPLFKQLDLKRRESATAKERNEYDALCAGYEGDELMEMNIAMYKLARKIPKEVWSEYQHADLHKLADRIKANMEGKVSNLPAEFLSSWKAFLNEFGFDGKDQLFVSSVRYVDSPTYLLATLKHNVGDDIKNPAIKQKEQLENRRKIMKIHENRAKTKWYNPFAVSAVQKRNSKLDHLMWIRNAAKLHLSRAVAAIRKALLELEEEFILNKRLSETGDIFHLTPEEVDRALENDSLNLKEIVKPRKIVYGRALNSKLCPLIIDSRCRILKPDVPYKELEVEPGTLIGTPISPGVVTGKVRIVENPTDAFNSGEILVALVTDPAWTPLFVAAKAVIIQIGGLLQHGALCAREYGKPAVSGIDIFANFKTGMTVQVDGNTGIVRIID